MFLPAHFHRRCRDEQRRNIDASFEDGKRYGRLPKIGLPAPGRITVPLADALDARESKNTFSADSRLDARDLSTLLHSALGPRPTNRHEPSGRYRRYPSGGARHPLEFYLDLRRGEDTPRGLYHFHPEEHALYRLLDEESRGEYPEYLSYEWSRDASAVLILSALWRRAAAKYFDFAYPNILIEAGHAAQNIVLCAAALRLSACPLAGFNDDLVNELLDLDGVEETPLYVIALGRAGS